MALNKKHQMLVVYNNIVKARLNKINVLCIGNLYNYYVDVIKHIDQSNEFEFTENKITDKVSGSTFKFVVR